MRINSQGFSMKEYGTSEQLSQANAANQQNNRKQVRNLNNSESPKNNAVKSFLEEQQSNAANVSEQRAAKSNTASKVKRLMYNFKGISAQIIRSKTPQSAKQAAGKARREVARLKAKLSAGEYDSEEIRCAIDHAKAMERAANKKARNLQAEEMVKISENAPDSAINPADIEEMEENLVRQDVHGEDLDEYILEEPEIISEDSLAEDFEGLMQDAMEEMLESSGLEDLVENLELMTPKEMNSEEFKLYRVKHRNSEMKDITEADAKYLKAVFDLYSSEGNCSTGESGMSAASPISCGVDIFI